MTDSTRELRLSHLQKLPRIGTSPLGDPQALERRLEDLALGLGDLLEERQSAKDPRWWVVQDLLDDALDCLEAVRGQPLGASDDSASDGASQP